MSKSRSRGERMGEYIGSPLDPPYPLRGFLSFDAGLLGVVFWAFFRIFVSNPNLFFPGPPYSIGRREGRR